MEIHLFPQTTGGSLGPFHIKKIIVRQIVKFNLWLLNGKCSECAPYEIDSFFFFFFLLSNLSSWHMCCSDVTHSYASSSVWDENQIPAVSREIPTPAEREAQTLQSVSEACWFMLQGR